MAPENTPEQGKLSDLESKLSNTQRINRDLIKEQMLAKKIIGIVFNDLLFMQKASEYESDELQEFVQQELQKRQKPASEAPQPKEEPKIDISTILEADKAKRAEAEALLKRAETELAQLKILYNAVSTQMLYEDKTALDEILKNSANTSSGSNVPELVRKFIIEKLAGANTAEDGAMENTLKDIVCSVVGSGIYGEAMKIQDPAERYKTLAATFKKSLADMIQRKYGATLNRTRVLEKDTAAKDDELKNLRAQLEGLQKELDWEKAKTGQYVQQTAGVEKSAELEKALESLSGDYRELSQAFNALHDLVKDYMAFESSIEDLKKNMEAK